MGLGSGFSDLLQCHPQSKTEDFPPIRPPWHAFVLQAFRYFRRVDEVDLQQSLHQTGDANAKMGTQCDFPEGIKDPATLRSWDWSPEYKQTVLQGSCSSSFAACRSALEYRTFAKHSFKVHTGSLEAKRLKAAHCWPGSSAQTC